MKRKLTILDFVYNKYRIETNMTARELKSWAKTSLSKKVSPNRNAIRMAIRLKSKPKRSWKLTEIKWALKKALPYLKRAKKRISKKIANKGYTKNQVALKNWGFDIIKWRKRRK